VASNATCVAEIEAQQAASDGIEAFPTFVLRGDVESDGSQVSHVFWDTPESVTTPSDFLHDWEGSSSEASATNIPEGYRYQLVGNDGERVRYSDYYYSATRTLRDHHVQAAIRNDAREPDAMQATTGLIAFEEPIRPRPADGGIIFGPLLLTRTKPSKEEGEDASSTTNMPSSSPAPSRVTRRGRTPPAHHNVLPLTRTKQCKAGTPTTGIWNAVVGRKGLRFCVQKKGLIISMENK
jgi:hypothetical protein